MWEVEGAMGWNVGVGSGETWVSYVPYRGNSFIRSFSRAHLSFSHAREKREKKAFVEINHSRIDNRKIIHPFSLARQGEKLKRQIQVHPQTHHH